MTDPPHECPTRTTSPSARSIALLVAVTSSARDVVGFCTEITLYPWSTNGLITLLQEEPSAQSPWTKTIVGFVFRPPQFGQMRLDLGTKRPRTPKCQFFSFMSPIALAKVASTNTASCSLDAQRSEDSASRGRRLRETPS